MRGMLRAREGGDIDMDMGEDDTRRHCIRRRQGPNPLSRINEWNRMEHQGFWSVGQEAPAERIHPARKAGLCRIIGNDQSLVLGKGTRSTSRHFGFLMGVEPDEWPIGRDHFGCA